MTFNYRNYIPTEEDIDPESIALVAIDGEVSPDIINHLPADSRAKLERALATGASAEVIRAIRQEYKEWIQLRIEMSANKAVDALNKVMDGHWIDDKTANAAVKAAEVTLDRAGFPKVSKTISEINRTDGNNVLPDLSEIIRSANPDDVSKITEDYLEAVRRLDAMRSGAKEIIDVRPGVQNESP